MKLVDSSLSVLTSRVMSSLSNNVTSYGVRTSLSARNKNKLNESGNRFILKEDCDISKTTKVFLNGPQQILSYAPIGSKQW